MPSIFAPNPLNDSLEGVPYSPSYTGPQYTVTNRGADALPSTYQPRATDSGSDTARWDQYVQTLIESLQASSGWNRTQLQAQLQDAEKGRANAYKIAQLQAENSRYGIDVNRDLELKRLQQNQQQFEANHDLEMQRLGLQRQEVGLNYAKTATDYLSTPDKYFQGSNYLNMASRVLAGQPGAAPYGSLGTATPKTLGDFAILASGGIPGQPAAGATPSSVATQAAGAGGAGADARIKALKAMIDAVPPSNEDGLNPNDFAVMQAAKALYSTNLTPKAYQTIATNPDYLGITNSALARGGLNPAQWHAQQIKNGIGQGSVMGA